MFSSFYFGQPPGGRFTVNALSTAFTQFPSIFNRSGSGPCLVCLDLERGLAALARTIWSGFFFFISLPFSKLQPKGIMPNKKQPVVFAQSVLCELAFIRATVKCLSEIVLDDIAARSGRDKAKFRSEFKARMDSKSQELFDHYVKSVGLEGEQDG